MGPPQTPFLPASLGGSTVFLFPGLTRAPAAQPQALFGGHIIGAIAGIACYQAFGDATRMGVCTCPGSGLVRHVDQQDRCHRRVNPILMVLRSCGLVSAVAAGDSRRGHICRCCCRLEPLIPRPLRYPVAWLERSPEYVLGWLGPVSPTKCARAKSMEPPLLFPATLPDRRRALIQHRVTPPKLSRPIRPGHGFREDHARRLTSRPRRRRDGRGGTGGDRLITMM